MPEGEGEERADMPEDLAAGALPALDDDALARADLLILGRLTVRHRTDHALDIARRDLGDAQGTEDRNEMVLQCGDGIGARARLHMTGTLSRVLVDELCDGHLPAACHPLLRRVTSSSNGSEICDCLLACLIGRDGARIAEIDALR